MGRIAERPYKTGVRLSLTGDAETRRKTHFLGAVAQIARFLQHYECLSDQIPIPADQKEYFDDCPRVIPDIRYLLTKRFE